MNKSKLAKVQNRLNRVLFGCYDCLHSWDEDGDGIDSFVHLHDVVSDIVTEDELQKIINEVKCPRDGCAFNTCYDFVMKRSESDIKADDILKKAHKLKPVLDHLHYHLSKFPYLGLKAPHKIGQKIIKGLEKKRGISINDETWHRARLLNSESRLFKKEELWAPDKKINKISEGRYNHTGMSFLYLSENPETAFLEVRTKDQNVCAIQKFKLNGLENILDLRTEVFFDVNVNPDDDIYALALIHNGHLYHQTNKDSSWKPEYLVPRFVADVARYLNFNGIVFTSIHSSGDNLILFEFSNKSVAYEGEPYLFTFKDYNGVDVPDDGRFDIIKF